MQEPNEHFKQRDVEATRSLPSDLPPGYNFTAVSPTAKPEAVPPLAAPVSRRRVVLPLVLFLATCYSTYGAGLQAFPDRVQVGLGLLGQAPMAVPNPAAGLQYMVAVIGILLAHEMGHFVMTLIHRVPASFPFFIPVPFSPLGTMGAVIGMDGRTADRRELFDIGIAGPLAGLVVAIPVVCIGVLNAEVFPANAQPEGVYHDPLIVKLLIGWLRPDLPENAELLLSPLLMAGWVGLLITGLNMMPISQLDGGHVIYGLFGRWAHWIARAFLVVAVAYVVLAEVYIWTLMIVLVALMGTDHPPTANDRAPLGPFRWALGLASLAIPILCFPPQGMSLGPLD